jgi:hypothetical protein
MTVDGFERDPDPVREGPEAAEGSDPEDDEER